MQLRQVDLNLLHVFDAVLKHRSVAQAAQQLALTPSAVSHALGRLRHVLKDELFVRDETGMHPTSRALELAGPIRDGLALLGHALASASFVPAESIRTFRIAAGEQTCTLILPWLVRRLGRVAPQVDLKIIPVARLDIARQLDSGTVDLVIGWFDALPEEFRRKHLVLESGAIIVRQGHPLSQGVVTPERLFEFPHIVVDLTGSEALHRDGFLDDHGLIRRVWMERVVLEAQGRSDLTARVAVSVPYFGAVAPLVRVSDMVATLPLRIAAQAVAAGGIVMLDPSLESGEVDVDVAWHSRSDSDAGLMWLLGELVAAGAEFADASVPATIFAAPQHLQLGGC